MNLTLIPLLVLALTLAATESRVDTTEVILSGQHEIEDHRGALIVGDAEVTIPVGVGVPGPIYVIGGQVDVAGKVDTDVIQLAGTVIIEAGATIGDELRHIGGTQSVSGNADVGRRTSLDLATTSGNPVTTVVLTGAMTLLLALIGSQLTRSRSMNVDNVVRAAADHPVVSITVGILVTLTALALIVFMASTLVLIPVALIGILTGLLTLGYAVIAWGYLLGTRLPVERPGLATGLGIVAVTLGLQFASRVPAIGALIVFGILLTGVGAIVVTYFGFTEFQPEPLPD